MYATVLVSLASLAWISGGSMSPSRPFAATGTPLGTAVETAQPHAPEVPPAGWYAVIGSGTAGGEVKTVASLPSFALEPGESLDPGVPASGLTAEFSGMVRVDDVGKYRFAAEVDGGSVVLTVYDAKGAALGKTNADGAARAAQAATAFFNLPKGDVQLSIKFVRKGDARARLRPTWEMERSGLLGFRAEPIPIASVSVPKFGRQAGAAGSLAAHGRALVGELNCTACHALPDGKTSNNAVSARTSPLLGEVGRRANPEWILKWILDPRKVKPGTRMPAVFADSPKDRQDAEAIVHFLVASYASEPPQVAAKEEDVIDQGRYSYHTLGCVACHGPLDPPAKVFIWEQGQSREMPATAPIAPLGDLMGKWKPAALAEFLRDPLRTHPGGRMPSLNLSVEESDLIATYLVNRFGEGAASAFKVDSGNVDAGKAAFAARGCANCHQIGHNRPAVASSLAAPGLAKLVVGKGCLDPRDAKTPRFSLSDADRAALSAGLSSAARAPVARAPIDAARRAIEGLNCRACHVKDAEGGPDKAITAYFRTEKEAELGDEGRLPPNISSVGFKLTTSWLKTVLTARGRARPYMSTRMPQFGETHVGALPEALGAESGVWANSDRPEPKPGDDVVKAGHRLVGDTALNCISCHMFGDLPPAGTPGPNIVGFAERLRYDWWKNYVMAPTRQKPGTRMPAFYATGVGAVTDVLGGNADKQTDAMWSYFNLGEFAPVPSGLNTGQGYVLSVGDRPMVFRTFLKDAGSRGIAVGFPSGLHFAFDAAAGRLCDAWRGGFIDASGAWAGRGGQVTDEKGAAVWTAPSGAALVLDAGPNAWPGVTSAKPPVRFRGYTLDKAGVPTFLYALGSTGGPEASKVSAADITERFEPATDKGVLFRRSFGVNVTIPVSGMKLYVNAGKGKVAIKNEGNCKHIDRVSDDGSKWFEVELSPGSPASFVVEYGS